MSTVHFRRRAFYKNVREQKHNVDRAILESVFPGRKFSEQAKVTVVVEEQRLIHDGDMWLCWFEVPIPPGGLCVYGISKRHSIDRYSKERAKKVALRRAEIQENALLQLSEVNNGAFEFLKQSEYCEIPSLLERTGTFHLDNKLKLIQLFNANRVTRGWK